MNTTLIRNHLLALGINVGLPVLILSPNLFWTGFSVANHLGSASAGAGRAYVLAMLVPAAYELQDALRRRDRSFLGVYAVSRTIINGVLVFWFVDGLAFAFKTAVDVVLQGLLFLGGAVLGASLLKPLLVEGVVQQVPAAQRHTLQEALAHPGMARAYWLGGVMMGAWKLLYGGIRIAVAYGVVTAAFGTAAFNAQVAFLYAVMYLPGLLLGGLALAPAMLLLERTYKSIHGPEVSLMRLDKLVRNPVATT